LLSRVFGDLEGVANSILELDVGLDELEGALIDFALVVDELHPVLDSARLLVLSFDFAVELVEVLLVVHQLRQFMDVRAVQVVHDLLQHLCRRHRFR